MFCPNCGTKIEPYPRATAQGPIDIWEPFPPCSECATRYVRKKDGGRFDVATVQHKHLYGAYCTCNPEPDEACEVDGYGVFMRHKEYQEVNSA